MSDGHKQSEYGNTAVVSSSRGISPVMWWFLVLAALIIFMQGAFVVGSSGIGHVWPASNSTKVQLPQAGR